MCVGFNGPDLLGKLSAQCTFLYRGSHTILMSLPLYGLVVNSTTECSAVCYPTGHPFPVTKQL